MNIYGVYMDKGQFDGPVFGGLIFGRKKLQFVVC